MQAVEQLVSLIPTDINDLNAGRNLASRIAWVLLALYKKVKLPKNKTEINMNRTIGLNAFAKLMAAVALAEHTNIEVPAKVVIEPITDAQIAGYVYGCINHLGQLCSKYELSFEDIAKRAYLPDTKFKRKLLLIGVDFIEIVSTAISGNVQQSQ
jgi:hypothetical protein